MFDREQDATIDFVGKQPHQLSLLVILLDKSQSAVSEARGLLMGMPAAARAAYPDRRGCRQHPAPFPEHRDH
jgi:hypothetical protein